MRIVLLVLLAAIAPGLLHAAPASAHMLPEDGYGGVAVLGESGLRASFWLHQSGDKLAFVVWNGRTIESHELEAERTITPVSDGLFVDRWVTADGEQVYALAHDRTDLAPRDAAAGGGSLRGWDLVITARFNK